MKHAPLIGGAFAILLFTALLCVVAPKPSTANMALKPAPTKLLQVAQPEEPQSITKTVALLPGQAANFSNRRFHRIIVRSEYPITMASGPCHNSYTVQWTCSNQEPGDLFIVDTRRPPVFMTPRANSVTITMEN
jgi:hypothetical protein